MADNSRKILEKAENFRARGLFSKARSSYLFAIDSSSDPSLRFDSFLSLASIARSIGEISEARRHIQKARFEMRRAGRMDEKEFVDLEEILIDRAEGKYQESISRLNAFLKRKIREKDFQACAFIEWALGGALRFSGQLEKSKKAYLRSLVLASKAKDSDGKIYALLGLGGVSRIQGRLSDSENYYRKAKNLLSKSADLFAKAYAYCGLGNALRQKGLYREAKGLYLKSRFLYRKLGDPADMGYVEWGLARVNMQQGNLKEARRFLVRALALFKQAQENRGLVLAKISLSQVLHALGETRAADILFKQAVELSRKSGLTAHLESFT